MNVLYIIGNGLDLSVGMKTDYQSFYDFYKIQQSKDPDILQMKASIEAGRFQTWADLEAGLGHFTKDIESESIFLKCLNNIKESLGTYLNQRFSLKKYGVQNRFVDDFYTPFNYLDDQIKENYQRFINRFSISKIGYNLHIVTLNYTETIEDIYKKLRIDCPSILHLHGSLEEGMVMGVSDVKQIANESFHKSRNVLEEFVKPLFNEACLNNNNSLCERWIKESELIVLFGTSLGATDRKWWRLIGTQLQKESKDILLMYFAFDKDKDIRLHPNYRLRWMEEYQRSLLAKLEIPDNKKDIVLSRICIGINKPIFQLGKLIKDVVPISSITE